MLLDSFQYRKKLLNASTNPWPYHGWGIRTPINPGKRRVLGTYSTFQVGSAS